MEPEILIFMPNGDVTLKLIRNVYEEEEAVAAPASKPKKPLSAVQQTSIDEDKQFEPEDAALDEVLDDESLLFYAPEPPNSADGPFFPPTPRAVRGSDASSRRDRSSSPPASFWAALKRQQVARNNEAIVEEEEEEEQPAPEQNLVKKERTIVSSHEVHCVVSSRHIILASKVFENLLTGNSTEAKTLRAKGHVEISMTADLETVIILLNIIHGPSRKVPRQVTLEELSNLATLVSNFGMIETVQFFSDTWIDALQREGLPKSYTSDVWRLSFVFWVFDRPDEFKNMTRLAQRESDENLIGDMKGVPIPQNIIDAIKREREYAIETTVKIIHTLISRYLDGQTTCDASLDEDEQYACDAMVLGSLMKSSHKIGLWPRPEAPFAGVKFKDLGRAIRGIKILDVCNKSSRRFVRLGTSGNSHGLEDELEAAMKGIEAGLNGLELLEYAKKSDDLSSGLQMIILAPEEEEVIPPVKENGVHEPHTYSEETLIPESPEEEIKPSLQTYSVPEQRIPTPPRMEIEEPFQEGLSLALHQPAQKSHYQRETHESRASSRASDYQVQEPVVTHTKEEQKPTISRSSPSQEWMNPGRVFPKATPDFEPVREPEEIRTQVVKEKEDLKPFAERVYLDSPIANVYKDEERANGNGYGNGHGTSNGNGVSKAGYGAPKANSVEEVDEEASRIQTTRKPLYPEASRFSDKNSDEKRTGRTPSQDRTSYPSQKVTHAEKISSEKRPEKTSSNERISYAPKASQPERASNPERIYSETISSTAKKNAPPEVPVSQTQRTGYSVQPSQSGKTSQPIQSASRLEKTLSQERNSYNGHSSQSESFHSQNATQSEGPAAHVQIERPYPSSQQSYNKNTEISQPQQKVVEREKSAPQVERPSQNSHSSYNSKSSHPDVSQQKVAQNDKPISVAEKSSYTSQPSNGSKLSQPEIGHSAQNFKSSPPPQSKAPLSPPTQSKVPLSPPQSKVPLSPQQPAKQTSETTAKETVVENSTLSEIDENWGQPQKFNMRKSKKKFSTRF